MQRANNKYSKRVNYDSFARTMNTFLAFVVALINLVAMFAFILFFVLIL